MPPFHTINVYFLKQILDTTKKSIKVDKVRVLYVPQYEALSSGEILRWAFARMPAIAEYFPDERDIHMLPRQVRPLSLVCMPLRQLLLVHHQLILYPHWRSLQHLGKRAM